MPTRLEGDHHYAFDSPEHSGLAVPLTGDSQLLTAVVAVGLPQTPPESGHLGFAGLAERH
eukprot:1250749-Amphidinium_carterae.1